MKISEEDLLILAETYHVQSHDKTSSLIQFCEELIALAHRDILIEQLQARVNELEQALRDVKEWVDRYTSPGHPVSTVCAKALKGNTNTGIITESNFDQLTPEQLRAGKMPEGKP